MIAYVDMFSGISGDMALGAFVDLGVPLEYLTENLTKVLSGFKIETSVVFRHHLRAVDVVITQDGNDPPSRNYRDIRDMIEAASLPETVKQNSLAAFEKIARAESRIHGTDIETVHFHEIGGIDSLVDIIGTFLCVDYLNIKAVYGSVIPLGSGTVTCSHGTIPVPVPATLAILENIPTKSSDALTEIVTPTGAALIATLGRSFGPMPDMIVKKTGYGAGKRDTGSNLPNLVRVVLGEVEEDTGEKGTHGHSKTVHFETIQVIEANVDDMSPEALGFLMEVLFENQALDVSFVPIQMKKNRPGVRIEVMCGQDQLDGLARILLSQTTSIGVRFRECGRYYLTRRTVVIKTTFGDIEVKQIIDPDGKARFMPEYEVVRTLARERNIPFKDVYARILSDAAGESKSLDRG